ncbi:MAG TPA: sigma 54-interacting transcriptional regulator [Anaeromyxobacter sp.]|nr:sigma 54-interacting transcriptional regulator [Anaeromyxobacter sp.]
MAGVVSVAHRVGVSGSNALVHGESGTGKETVARLVHAAGLAPEELLFVVACAGRSERDLDDELFGPAGVAGPAPAKLARAAGGTLLLEDVGELPIAVQARLVRCAVDAARGARRARVVGTTATDLRALVAAGRFRRDLFDALACHIHVPPLRVRPGDALAILDALWAEVGAGRELAAEARELLRQYTWPGNVREVDSVARRLAASAGPPLISAHDVERHLLAAATGMPLWRVEREARPAPAQELPRADPAFAAAGIDVHLPPDGTRGVDLQAILRRVEATLIGWALDRTGGNKAAAAGLLGLRRTTLVEKIRRLREDLPPGRPGQATAGAAP